MSSEDKYWQYFANFLNSYVENEVEFWKQWISTYEDSEQNEWPVNNLSLFLSMLARPFRIAMTIEESNWRSPSNSCSYEKISGGVKCYITNNATMNNFGIDRDHRFPESLGGIKHISNQLDLCPHHNRAKNNGLWGYDWNPKNLPEWITIVLKQMYDDVKRHQRDQN